MTNLLKKNYLLILPFLSLASTSCMNKNENYILDGNDPTKFYSLLFTDQDLSTFKPTKEFLENTLCFKSKPKEKALHKICDYTPLGLATVISKLIVLVIRNLSWSRRHLLSLIPLLK